MSMYEIASGSDICSDVEKSDNVKFMQILKTIAIDENQDREKSDDIQFHLSESPNVELSLTIHSQSYDFDMQMTPSVVTTADDTEQSLIPFQNRHNPDLLITNVDNASEFSVTNPQQALIPAPAQVKVKVLKQALPEMSAQPEIPDVERLKIDEPTAPSPNAPSPDPAAQQQPSKEAPETLDGADEEAFESNFKNFAKFGDPKSDGKLITLSNSDKWMKQAKIIDGKKITTTDTGIYFKKLKSQKVSVKQYRTFIEDLAKAKKVEVNQIVKKLSVCGAPGLHGIANAKATETVNRLTDTSKYTGTHKQRFDQTGKGKGIAGRKDLPDNSGYVTGYQHKDTYEAK